VDDREVKWSEAAWADLDQIAGFLARDSRAYAAAFVQEVRDKARALEVFSSRGRIVPEFGDPSIREVFIRKHRLIYRLSKDVVHVLALIHGVRDLQAAWEERTRDEI
jgi:plasmid stabilization system protein ParE